MNGSLSFLGLGAQKSGSTWLYFMLREHPGLYLPPVKELHFWDRDRAHGLDWYRAQFAPAPPGTKAGEITPAYAILSHELIAEVRREFPDIRLLYLLRNPVERAWSGALMAVPRAEMTVGEASDRWFIDHFNSAGSRCRGDYKACMEAWRRQFEAERLRWFLYDEVVADPRSVLVACAGHLGVDPGFFRDLPEDRLNARYNEGTGVPIRPSLHAYLARLYRPQILALQDYLNRDLSAWLEANDRAMEAAPRRWLDRLLGR